MQSVISKASTAAADVHVADGDRIVFGNRSLQVRATPGHTEGCVSYVADDESFVLTGDTLLIQGYVYYRSNNPLLMVLSLVVGDFVNLNANASLA